MSKGKTHCYSSKCGPIVSTGFNIETYFVCRECKAEVSEKLKDEIEARSKKKSEPNNTKSMDEELLELMGLFGSHNDPMD